VQSPRSEWLPLLCRGCNGTGTPVLTGRERAEMVVAGGGAGGGPVPPSVADPALPSPRSQRSSPPGACTRPWSLGARKPARAAHGARERGRHHALSELAPPPAAVRLHLLAPRPRRRLGSPHRAPSSLTAARAHPSRRPFRRRARAPGPQPHRRAPPPPLRAHPPRQRDGI
jgi:hypothetical protein